MAQANQSPTPTATTAAEEIAFSPKSMGWRQDFTSRCGYRERLPYRALDRYFRHYRI